MGPTGSNAECGLILEAQAKQWSLVNLAGYMERGLAWLELSIWTNPCKVGWTLLSAQDCHLKDQESQDEGSSPRARVEMEAWKRGSFSGPRSSVIMHDITQIVD